ncbi:hypothetical protein ACLOJK_041152 [Asimina triloba]
MSVSRSWRAFISTVFSSSRAKITRPIFRFFLQCTHFHGVFFNWKLKDESFQYIKLVAPPPDDIAVVDASLTFLPSHQDFHILNCHDGLLLCSSKCKWKDWEAYCLYNPLTRKWIMLPKARVARHSATTTLAFESPILLHYKVFRFFNPSNKRDGDRHICAEVFSSRTGEWVEQEMALDVPIKDLYEQGAVFWDGALFLTTYKHLAVRVEVKEEHGRVLKLPSFHLDRPLYPSPERLGVLKGQQSYICRNRLWLQIWMLVDGSDEWVY